MSATAESGRGEVLVHNGGEEVSVMMAPAFFALGVASNLCLILLFTLRRRRLDLVQRFGWLSSD